MSHKELPYGHRWAEVGETVKRNFRFYDSSSDGWLPVKHVGVKVTTQHFYAVLELKVEGSE
jgi:hypothetical protein